MTTTETSDMKKTSVIDTKVGKVQGYIKDGLEIFKNIPFAEPPVGDLRFKPPVAIQKPRDGVLDTSEFGFCAYQGYTPLEDWFGKEEPESEDCLNLNIWTPGSDGKKRPVMVWVHGGAYVTGSGKATIYDGSYLAKRGGVVIVTINYRLGAFGFLYGPDSTPNVGMLDQVTALKWVHDNIELFGGDPNNVTIFGESAGGYSVLTLMAAPAARGLFKRVISQSPPVFRDETTEKVTKGIMRKFHLKKGDLDGLRKIPAEDIIKAQNEILAKNVTMGMAFKPKIDVDMPNSPLKTVENGECKNIDLMIGSNLEEFKLFAAGPEFSALDDEGLEKMVSGFLTMSGVDANKTKEIIETYKREGGNSSLFDNLMILVSDAMFRIHSYHYLEAQYKLNPNTYNYLFDMKSPFLDGKLGACHALELPFVFGTIKDPEINGFSGTGSEVDAVSEQMMDAWIAFARTGSPNADSIPEWPAYETEKRSTMLFSKETKVVENFLDKQREAWGDMFRV